MIRGIVRTGGLTGSLARLLPRAHALVWVTLPVHALAAVSLLHALRGGTPGWDAFPLAAWALDAVHVSAAAVLLAFVAINQWWDLAWETSAGARRDQPSAPMAALESAPVDPEELEPLGLDPAGGGDTPTERGGALACAADARDGTSPSSTHTDGRTLTVAARVVRRWFVEPAVLGFTLLSLAALLSPLVTRHVGGWGADLSGEPHLLSVWDPAAASNDLPFATLFLGSVTLAVTAVDVAVLIGFAWVCLHPLRARFPAGAPLPGLALWVASGVPALVVCVAARALWCQEAARRAAELLLEPRIRQSLGFASAAGASVGWLTTGLCLGLAAGYGLWRWLDAAWRRERRGDALLVMRLEGRGETIAFLRVGVWLRRRRELAGLLLQAGATAMLLDVAANAVIDALREVGYPLYPSLGSVLYLHPDPGPFARAFAATVGLGVVVLVFVEQPATRAFPTFVREQLRIGRRTLAYGRWAGTLGSFTWVVGPSGAGKTSLLRARARAAPSDILFVPQDPDDALPVTLSVRDVVSAAPLRHRDALAAWLTDLFDLRLAAALTDPYTPVGALSRGERQRLAVCLALAGHARGRELALDEFTSAQDADRTDRLFALLRRRIGNDDFRAVSACSHDPHLLHLALADRVTRLRLQRFVLVEGGRLQETDVSDDCDWPTAWERDGAVPQPLQELVRAVHLLTQPPPIALAPARPSPLSPSIPMALPATRGPVRYALADNPARQLPALSPPSLTLLYGPSGGGKSVLLRAWAERMAQDRRVASGYIPQDPGRVFPPDMTVYEAVAPGGRLGDARRLLGPDFAAGPDDRIGVPLGELSEGQRQRVLLVRQWLRLNTKDLTLLLLDEPFGSVDPVAHVRLLDELLVWLGTPPTSRRAAILITHSANADRARTALFEVSTQAWRVAPAEGR